MSSTGRGLGWPQPFECHKMDDALSHGVKSAFEYRIRKQGMGGPSKGDKN